MVFKVAIAQYRANVDKEKNAAKVMEWIEAAANNNADILLLPECFLTGYYLPKTNEEVLDDNDKAIAKICEKAKEHHIGVVLTSLTKGKNKPKNSAYVVNKEGKILMKYNKVHTCDFADESSLESGDEFFVCDFETIKIGVMICYDREYPESARILMLKGAEIILVPNDCGSMCPRVQALSTRAYENMVGIAMANPNGTNAGNSCAFSPICWDEQGKCVENTLVMADDVSEGLYYAEFDMDELRKYREHEMLGNTFRKIKAYDELLNGKVEYPFVRVGQE